MLKLFCGLMIAATVGSFFALKNLTHQFQDLLPENSKFRQSEKAAAERYPISEQLIIRVTGPNPDANELFTQQLGDLLNQKEKTEYEFKSAKDFFESHAAFYINPKHFEEVIKTKNDGPLSFLSNSLSWINLMSGAKGISRYAQMNRGYFASPDRQQYVLIVFPKMQHASYEQAKAIDTWATQSIDKIKNSNPLFKDVKTDRVGSVTMVINEHESVFDDLLHSTLIIMALILIVLFLYFRSLTSVILALIPAICGVILTLTISSPLLYPLSANSVFFLSVILGNGMNAAVIYLGRAAELKATTRNWLKQAVLETRRPTFVASFAAACSYGALAISSFKGFFQLGVLGILGMFLCWLITYYLLPKLLSFKYISDRFKAAPPPPTQENRIAKWFQRKYVSAISIGLISLCILGLFLKSNFQIFELNLDNLRSKKSIATLSIYYEVAKIFGGATNPIIVLAKDSDSACRIAKRIRSTYPPSVREPFIRSSICLDDLVPAQQSERITELGKLIKKHPLNKNADPRLKTLYPKIQNSLHSQPFTEQDLPKIILDRFTEKDGTKGRTVLIELTQDRAIWEKGLLFKIVEEILKIVDEEDKSAICLSGHFLATELVEIMNREGLKVIFISLIAVIFGVLILLRRERATFFVLTSLALGMLWFMGLWIGFNLKIQFISFMAIPITLGVGVDYAINLYHRRNDTRVGAIVLCSLTTIIGWGAFAFANNQALASFGFAAVLGEITCLLAALLIFWWSLSRTLR